MKTTSPTTWFSRLKVGVTALTATTLLAGCGNANMAGTPPMVVGQQQQQQQPQVPMSTGGYNGLPGAVDHGPNGPSRMVMKGVRYRVGPKLFIDVPGMEAVMIPGQPGAPVVMDDPSSFSLMIANGMFALDADNVASLMNNYVLNYPDPPMKNLTATLTNGRMNMKGTMHKGVDFPFEMEGTATVTASGKILLTPDKVKAMGFSSLPLMKLAGLSIESMCTIREGRGVVTEGNTIIMDPTKMLPAPAISGRVSQVQIAPDPKDSQMKLMISFGGGPQAVRDEKLAAPQAPNYMHILGGVVRFVNTYSTFTNLQIVDADPSDYFDFYLNEYGIQMLQGVIILSPNGSTLSLQPDYLKRNTPIRPNVPGNLLPNGEAGTYTAQPTSAFNKPR
ncbi:MAG: hypothetical protein H7338_19300 [Candidatus Sericytochromatia bacterium]|nr:hypothetical protein [Candidatus Sericytochromatia bacterium]